MPFNVATGARSVARVALAVLLGSVANPAMALLRGDYSPAASARQAQTIVGTATYRERMALPSGAVLEATLEDVSRADAKAERIAQTRVTSPGNPPIAFTIAYDPATILADHRYVVRARILVDDNLLFTTDTAAPVITRGSPNSVKLMLRRVGGSQHPPAAGAQAASPLTPHELTGTSWRLVKFRGSDGTTLTPDDRTKYTLEFGAGWRLSARIDCNRGSGSWKSSGPNQLQLGPLALTRAMCPPASMHDHIVKQLPNIRSYVIEDGHLFVSLMANGGIYEYEPIAPPKP